MINDKIAQKVRNLKLELKYVNRLFGEFESDLDVEIMYKDARDGTCDGNKVEWLKPDKKFASWIAKRYKLNEEDLKDD